ncbi:hypothetical protein JOF41_006336 [Saccharothrix coeruleofusca]|uniref:hypothetical protein n=1 Tax=Saccharothrix coeruleofusca TaxID=33919 RepID=UPI001AEBA40D|nr:hypothetical protein [Saccharothrix coeruleofusca]MBP2340158.1 hypothetical protein [Saccharothrix coeruleofusca]
MSNGNTVRLVQPAPAVDPAATVSLTQPIAVPGAAAAVPPVSPVPPGVASDPSPTVSLAQPGAVPEAAVPVPQNPLPQTPVVESNPTVTLTLPGASAGVPGPSASAPDPSTAVPDPSTTVPDPSTTVTLPQSAAPAPDTATPATAPTTAPAAAPEGNFTDSAQADLQKATTALDAVDKQQVKLAMDRQSVDELVKLIAQARDVVNSVHAKAVNELDVELKFGDNWVGRSISKRLHEVAVGDEQSAVAVIGDFLHVLFEIEETIRKAARNLEDADDEAVHAVTNAGRGQG